jgi:hypothetical protein
MATELEKLNHQRNQAVHNHAERKQKRANDLQQTKDQAVAMVQYATDCAERDQKNEDALHASRLADLDLQIASATA